MHIISYATLAQSQFPMVVKYNTVSQRHKHSPERLFIHINQCIHIVLAFTNNARQLIIHLKYFYQQKFNFFFRKFCLILINFILFDFSKKKVRILLFTVNRSTVTVHGYCWSQYKKLYCNTIYLLHYCIAIQFSSFLPLQYTLVYCNTISFLTLQVTIQSKYCNTILPTIQYSLLACNTILYCNSPRLFLQYNSSYSSLLLYNTKIVLQYNFHYNFSNPLSCNTIARLAIQKSSLFFFFHNTIGQ